jgi:hypothetical protein
MYRQVNSFIYCLSTTWQWSSRLKVGIVCFSEMLVSTHKCRWHHIPEENHHLHHCKNLRLHKLLPPVHTERHWIVGCFYHRRCDMLLHVVNEGCIHVQNMFTAQLHYLSDNTVSATNGILQHLCTYDTEVTLSATHS